MKITPLQYARSLNEILKETSNNQVQEANIIENFVKILEENDDVKIAPVILDLLYDIQRKEGGVINIETSHNINRERLAENLNNKKISLSNDVRKGSLESGIIITVNDLKIENSIENRIQRLKKMFS